MDLDFGNTLLQNWYDLWLCVVGLAVALLLTVLVIGRANWQTSGLLLKTALVAAALAAIPLALARLSLSVGFAEEDGIGYLSMAGVFASLAIGLPYLYFSYRSPRLETSPPYEEVVTPEQGMPVAPYAEDATRTLASEGTIVDTPPGMVTGEGLAAAPTEAPPAFLLIKSGPRAGQSIPLNPGVTSIGRGSENDLVVDDPAVSRQHATIVFQEGQYVVEDAGSSNGTMVEGSPTARTVLSSGSALRLGETELVFMQAEGTMTAGATSAGAAPGPGAQQPGETLIMEQPETVMAWLAVTSGADKGKTYQLTAKDTTIGRDQENDLVQADAVVSRRHALLKYQDGKFLLLDLGSSGGSKVGDQSVGGRSLSTGGAIGVGQTQLTLVETESSEDVAPATSSGATMVAQPESSGGVLVVQSGPDSGKSFPLVQGENTIGRDPSCQILLTDPAVSRLHALIRRDGEASMVYDLGSRTGTTVEGETLTGHSLSSGDVIAVGRSELTMMQIDQPQR